MTSTVTCASPTTILPKDYDDVYPGAIKLLSSSVRADERDASGLLKKTTVDARVESLSNAGGVIPDPRTAAPAVYRQKVEKLLEEAKKEYCHYYTRYEAALNYLFSGIKETVGNNSEDLQLAVKGRMEKAQELNRKVNDLIQIMNAITEKMLSSSTMLQSKIQTVNAELRKKRDGLAKQNAIIQSNEAAMRLQKEMVKYTEEKARYSDNLLKLYSVLNIVARGLLVYVYKAAGEE